MGIPSCRNEWADWPEECQRAKHDLSIRYTFPL
jgi:hypothetical protein